MNEELAKKRAREIKNKNISGWIIGDYIGSGKTAFVCEARNNKKKSAIKIFETDFLGEKEIEELKIRLERQLTLISKKHPNLIEIYGGGYSEDIKCYYLVMEYINAAPLSRLIKEIPRDKICTLVTQIASAAEFIESLDLAHRDIKPDNIVVNNDFSKAVLLDFGVIKPLGKDELTDSTNTHRFVGTLRYSSPEFLFRLEENSRNGWRAVTFYQIGAVLHDMIMRVPIFEGQTEPFAKLVHAIEYETPALFCEDVDPNLIHLARLCLLKPPNLRLRMINWDDFKFPRKSTNYLQQVKARIIHRNETTIQSIKGEQEEDITRLIDQYLYDIRSILDSAIRETCIGNGLFPKLTIQFYPSNDEYDLLATISFASSLRHSITNDFTVLITASIIDLTTKLIQLQCAAILEDKIDYIQATNYLSIFYEDFIDDARLKASIDDMLHIILDQAQLKCDSLSTLSDRNIISSNPWIVYKLEEEKNQDG